MKNICKLPIFLLGLLFFETKPAKAQNEDVSLQSFYDELSPYGTWIQDPEYGYVWRPDVDQDEFRPYYSNGRWVMTEYGNTWVSDYSWGWAPFHYGRWMYNRYNRWIWIPDTVWGPAWVSWRSGNGYYGWAPMGPQISVNIGIGRSYRVPDFCWNFTPYANIYINTFPSYRGYRSNAVYIQNTVIINNTYVRNNRTYYTGPRADEVRRYTNRDVPVYRVGRSERSGPSVIENNTVNIYRPRPDRVTNNGNSSPRNSVAANIRTQVVDRDNRVINRPSRAEGIERTGRGTMPEGRQPTNRNDMFRTSPTRGQGENNNGVAERGTGDMNRWQNENRAQRATEPVRQENRNFESGRMQRPSRSESFPETRPRTERFQQPQRMENNQRIESNQNRGRESRTIERGSRGEGRPSRG